MKIRKSFLGFPTFLIMVLMVGCQENSPQDLDGEFGNNGKVILKLTGASVSNRTCS